MGILDFLIIGIVAAAFLAAIRFLKKNGNRCGGCSGDCMNCSKNKK
ncbi:MAG: FeoB-associated Cys-rich membrane protein [Anaerotignum sp.]|nr:FeoB-associated Cys-rich membrane protein [Anaerotignum sp.]